MSDPFWFLKGPYIIFTCGAACLFAGIVWTYTGKVWDRYHGWVYRADGPRRFWWEVAAYYLAGVGLIIGFWYKVHGASK
jgi:hypothetical protein